MVMEVLCDIIQDNTTLIEYEKFSPFYRSIGIKRGHFNSQVKYLKSIILENYINSILDTSCGSGDVLNELVSIFPDIKFHGSDGCHSFINQAKQLNNCQKIFFNQCSWVNLNKFFSRNTFDLIYTLGNSIAHVSTIEEFGCILDTVYNLLKKDGLFIFDLRSWDNIASNKSFNEPLRRSNNILINDKLEYMTSYSYIMDRHFLFHKIQEKKSKKFIEEIELSFIDFSKYDLDIIIGSTRFNILRNVNKNTEYPFITYQLIK